MCGICGVTYPGTGAIPEQAATLAQGMLARMRHRGPNGAAVFGDTWGAIGANRLAIRSVRDSLPPLVVHSSGIVMACNGEIDNHRVLRSELREKGHVFSRTSDVEVIIPLYLEHGLDFTRHLDGAFAIALWDPHRERLLLARDRAGERHLYFADDDDRFAFATELAALRSARSPQPLAHIAGTHLGHGFRPARDEAGDGFHKLPPGTLLIAEAGRTRRHVYWDCPLGRRTSAPPDLDRFDCLFRDAVARQTDADVDYGVLLSGGVDSSLITAVARAVHPDKPPLTFGIRFDEASFDEGGIAASVAERLGCHYAPVTVRASDVPDTLRDLVHGSGELLADPAWIPMSLLARRASQEVRLVLGGEGADELFGGYPTYMGAQLAARYQRLPRTLRELIRHGVERLPVSDKKMTVSFLLKRFVQGQALDAGVRHQLWTANIAPSLLHRLGMPSELLLPETSEGTLMDRLQRHDFCHALPEALLAKADRGGMRHSLEVRAPFLDPQVIEFAARLPSRARVSGLNTKAFLKRYALRYLPRDVVYRRKRGLSVPLTAWLRGPLHDWAHARLDNPHLAAAGIDCRVALKLLAEHAAHREDHARALWTLLVYSEWLEWMAQPLPALPAAALADIDITLAHDVEQAYA